MTSGVQPKYVKGIDQMRMPAEAKRLAEQTLKEMQGVDPREFMGTMPEKIDPIPFVPAECRYEIGGRVYIQRKPKLMQQRQLLNVLKQSDIDFGNLQIEPSRAGIESIINSLLGLGINTILSLLGDAIPAVLAILLTPEGVTLKDKDLGEIQAHLEAELGIAQEVGIAADFFDYLRVVRAEGKRELAERRAKLARVRKM